MNSWARYGVWTQDELEAVSEAMAAVHTGGGDGGGGDGERASLVRFALRMHRRGFRDPAKLVILCRKASDLSGSNQIS